MMRKFVKSSDHRQSRKGKLSASAFDLITSNVNDKPVPDHFCVYKAFHRLSLHDILASYHSEIPTLQPY